MEFTAFIDACAHGAARLGAAAARAGIDRRYATTWAAISVSAMLATACSSGSGGDNGHPDAPAPQALTFSYPFDGQRDVLRDAPIALDFDGAVSAGAAKALTLRADGRANASARPVAVDVARDDDQPNILRLTPRSTLAPATRYALIAGNDFTAGDTSFNAGDALLTFNTRPRSGSPAEGDFRVLETAPGDVNPATGRRSVFTQFNALRVTFSQAVAASSVAVGRGFALTDAAGDEVPGRLTVSGRYLTFDPSADLDPGRYTLTLSSDVRSAFGETLDAYQATRTVVSAGTTATENLTLMPSANDVDALPDNELDGGKTNLVTIRSQLIGVNRQPAADSPARAGVRTTLAEPGRAAFSGVIPAVIRAGQKVQLTPLSLRLNGDVPTAVQSGPIEVNFANDASIYLQANDYRDMAGPTAVRLRFDLAIATQIDPDADPAQRVIQTLANGVFNQTILNIQAAGVAIPQDNGDLKISTLGSFPLRVNRDAHAAVNFALTFVLPAGDQTAVRDDRIPPALTAQSPSACLYTFGGDGYDAAYAENGAAPTALPEQICAARLGARITGFPLESAPAITFSEPIDPASVNAQSVALTADDGSSVAANYAVDGTSVVIAPDRLLAPATNYTITLDPGRLTDLAGNPLATAATGGPALGVSFATEPLVLAPAGAPPLLGSLTPGLPCALTGGDFADGGDRAGHCVGDAPVDANGNGTPSADFPVFQNPANNAVDASLSTFVRRDSIVLADGCLTAGGGATNSNDAATIAVERIDDDGQCLGAVAGALAFANADRAGTLGGQADEAVYTRAFSFRPAEDFQPGARYWIVVCGTARAELVASDCRSRIQGPTGELDTTPLVPAGDSRGGADIVMPFDAVAATDDYFTDAFTLPQTDTNGNGAVDDGEIVQAANSAKINILGRDYRAYLSLNRPLSIGPTQTNCGALDAVVDDAGEPGVGDTPDACIRVALKPGGFSALTGIDISAGAANTALSAVAAAEPGTELPGIGTITPAMIQAASALLRTTRTVPADQTLLRTGRVLLRFPRAAENDANGRGPEQTGYIVARCTGRLNGQAYDYEPCFAASLRLTANAPNASRPTLAIPQQPLTLNLLGPVTFEQNGRLVISLRNLNTFALNAVAGGVLNAPAVTRAGDLYFQLVGNAIHGGRALP